MGEETPDGSASTPTTVINTQLGEIKGIKNEDVWSFRGIRYAQPPVGELRFAPPKPATSWSGVKDATQFPNRCMQIDTPFFGEPVGPTNEDCLFLNIETPSTEGSDRPVLFWIHGGGLTTGSANDYNGSMLAKQGDVVVVTINYRLGLFGFLDLSTLGEEFVGSASNGIRDQILALQWVRDNIQDYGGDSKNVTIFGESAGGYSVLALLAAPDADGLYHKAIAHSPSLPSGPPGNPLPVVKTHLADQSGNLTDDLRSVSAVDLLAIQTNLEGIQGGVDGTVVTRSTVEAIKDRGDNGVPLIAGSNKDEGLLFLAILKLAGPDFILPNEDIAQLVVHDGNPTAYIEGLKELHPDMSEIDIHLLIWDALFRKAATQSALAAEESGAGGWLYQFNFPATQKFLGQEIGAAHAAEIPFTFNRYNTEEPGTLVFNDSSDPVVRNLSQRWSDTLIQFAKTGNPNGAGLPQWPRYTAENRDTLVLDAESRIEQDLNREERLIWEKTLVRN